MPRVDLNKNQEKLYKEVKKEFENIIQIVRDESGYEDIKHANELIKTLAKRAHKLHISLKETGNEPKHHKYMINNRGVSPDEVKFYEHIHPIEDLLKFIDNPTANDDPIDQTIGEEFTFRVYSKRQDANDNYKIKRTSDGWYINFFGIGGSSDKSGSPYLFKNFDQDLIEYPNSIGEKMEWLWYKAKDEGLTKEQVQEALNDLANWISELERTKPVEKVWQGF